MRGGLGLALDDVSIRGVSRSSVSSVEAARFEAAIQRGTVAARPEAMLPLQNPGPEDLRLVYEHDAQWAGAATLVDRRNPGRCGGGGCNAPSCAFQYWNIGLPCNQQNLQAYLFQLPRYVFAQKRLRQLWSNPPENFHLTSNRSIAEKAYAWSTWLAEVYRAIALQRWACNVRWELVSSKVRLPFEHGLDVNQSIQNAPWVERNIAPVGGSSVLPSLQDELLVRYMQEAANQRDRGSWDAHVVGSMIMESPLTWAYQQAGNRYIPDAPSMGFRDNNSGGDLRALAWELRVPQSAADFSPQYGAWLGSVTPTYPALPYPGANNRRANYEFQTKPDYAAFNWQNFRPMLGSGDLGRFLAAGRRSDGLGPTALAMPWAMTGSRAWILGNPPTNLTYFPAPILDDTVVVPTPYMQVQIAKARAEAYMNLDFGVAVSAGLSAWAEMLLAMPEELRGVDARSIEALQANMLQSQLSEAASYVGAGFGAAASLVTAVVPQPYGAIIGAVIAIIGAIVTALMSAAYDLGLARPDRPPCPAPPLLRMIESEDGACDFDAARRGVEEVLGKSAVIATLAGDGVVDPAAWLPALQALSARPMDSAPPALPPPDVQRPFDWTGPLVFGGSIVGVGLLAKILLSRR